MPCQIESELANGPQPISIITIVFSPTVEPQKCWCLTSSLDGAIKQGGTKQRLLLPSVAIGRVLALAAEIMYACECCISSRLMGIS